MEVGATVTVTGTYEELDGMSSIAIEAAEDVLVHGFSDPNETEDETEPVQSQIYEIPHGYECEPQDVEPLGVNFFEDISLSSGIQDENYDASPISPIPINDHSRLGFVDINGDGFDDIVMHSLYPNPQNGIPFEHLVFKNNGDGTFENESSNLQSNVAKPSNGSVACDYDNDGDLDIFVSVYGVSYLAGHNVLWENDGNGSFTNVAEVRGFAYLTTGNYFLSTTGYGTEDESSPGSDG